MPADVLEDPRTLPVLPRRQFLDDQSAGVNGARERRVDVGHPHLDDVRDGADGRRGPVAAGIPDNNGAVGSDPQLCAVRVPDPDLLLEPERRLEPRDSRPHVRVVEHWSDGGRWR